MALSLQHTYECDSCGKLIRETQTHLFPEEHIVKRLMAPSGWTWVGHRLFCPEHEVKVDDVVVVLAQKDKAIA